MSGARPESLVGDVVADRFELVAFVAAGGMGQVFQARDRATGELVALKRLPPAGDAARFAREAEVLAAMDHPGVVRYVAHGEGDRGSWLAMEWLVGHDLSDRIARGPMPIADTIAIGVAAARALGAVHRRGIVHRDVKPGNVFLVEGRADQARLVDFGLARASLHGDLTATGALVGTPAYMAPEQVRASEVDPRADVYGLAAVLYACLVGAPPFKGAHLLAVLAKILLEEPAPIREHRADAPAALEAVLARALSKDPRERPSDGDVFADALAAAQVREPSGATASAVTAREQRIACVVLCASAPTSRDDTLAEGALDRRVEAARSAIEQAGAELAALADGAWVVTVSGAQSPAEQATRAARSALAVARAMPHAPVYVATGKVVVGGEGRVGEVVDRAADALLRARAADIGGGVRVDGTTAELLEGRFRIVGKSEWRVLVKEDDAPVSPARMLLGKPAPCVGRDQPLAMLVGTLDAAAEDRQRATLLVTAAPGMGKTRLVQELLHRRLAGREDLDVLVGAGEAARAASPYAVCARMIRHAAGIAHADPPEAREAKLAAMVARDLGPGDRERHAELLGEIAGVRAPTERAAEALGAARADVTTMADRIRDAWTTWLGARARARTVLLVTEDAQWADAASLRLLDDAAATLEEAPIVLLFTARPEGASGVTDRMRARGLVEVNLAPLSGAAAERLVRHALADRATDDVVRALVRRSGGHPFHLEELVRAVAEGRGDSALPDTVLGMVQARLDDLGRVARRTLRAASVLGDAFWPGAVAALLGDEVPRSELEPLFDRLVEAEVITAERASKWPGERELRFRHMLLRDGAYAMLTDGDRAHAHLRAAEWLEAAGETEPIVLAEHYDRGGAGARAAQLYRRAAGAAMRSQDIERAAAHVARARELLPAGAVDGALEGIHAEILYWKGDLAGAAERARVADAALPLGSFEWFEAAAVAIGAHGQLGRNAEVLAWLSRVADAEPPPERRGVYAVAVCRGMTQLFWAHHRADLGRARARLDELVAAGGLDAYEEAWVRRVRGESAWLHARDVGACLRELEESVAGFERADALRAGCLARLNLASLLGWSGAADRGLELAARARTDAERIGAAFLVRYARVVLAVVSAYAARPGADAAARDALPDVAGSPRLAFLCELVQGASALDRGDVESAAAVSRSADARAIADDLRPAALALASRVALARGDHDGALSLAEQAAAIEADRPDLELTFGFGALARAAALHARGDAPAAALALAPATRAIAAIAATIPEPDRRAAYLARPLPNAEIAALAAVLGAPA